MGQSNHLWPDPGPEMEWEVWSEDTFDREARPTMDLKGRGLVDGLQALWIRFLLETVQPGGGSGFSRFYLRRLPPIAASVTGPWEGAVRLRNWVFGTKKRDRRGYFKVADRRLLEALIHIHAQLLLLERSTEPILTLAAEATDRRDFVTKLEELANPWGVILSQVPSRKVANLTSLEDSMGRGGRPIPKQPAPTLEWKSRKRGRPSWWDKLLRIVDPQLVVIAGALLFGLFFLAVLGLQYKLNCSRIESNQISCIHRRSWLGLIPVRRQPIEGLWRARVGQICNSDGCTAFVELDTEKRPIRFNDGSTGKSAPEYETAEEINAFLAAPDRRDLEIVINPKVSSLIVPAVFLVGGTILLGVWIYKFLKNPKRRRGKRA